MFIVFEENPTRRVAALVLRRLGGDYSLMGRARLDDDTPGRHRLVPISDGAHFVEIDWRRSSGPDANDGVVRDVRSTARRPARWPAWTTASARSTSSAWARSA